MRSKSRFSIKKVIIGVLVIVLLVLLVERFITQGTILGYQIRHSENKITDSSQKEQPSEACKRLTNEEASAVLGLKMVRIAENLGDKKSPNFYTVCSYRSEKGPYRSATIVMRDVKDETTAKKQADSYRVREGAKAIGGLGDQAYFLSEQRQVVVRDGKRITTVTVSEPTDASRIGIQDAATQLIKQVV